LQEMPRSVLLHQTLTRFMYDCHNKFQLEKQNEFLLWTQFLISISLPLNSDRQKYNVIGANDLLSILFK